MSRWWRKILGLLDAEPLTAQKLSFFSAYRRLYFGKGEGNYV